MQVVHVLRQHGLHQAFAHEFGDRSVRSRRLDVEKLIQVDLGPRWVVPRLLIANGMLALVP